MKTIVELYFRLLRLLIVLCMIGMVVMVFGNVVLRYAFNSGISVSEELARWLFVWMVFLGSLIALREHQHLALDSLLKRLPGWLARVCLIVGHGLMLLIAWLMLRGSWEQAQINLDVVAPASGLSMAWFYGVGVLFGACSGLILLFETWRLLSGQPLRIDAQAQGRDVA